MCLLSVLGACNVKPTNRKSWAGNLLMWSHLALNPHPTSHPLQDQTRPAKLKIAYNLLIIAPEGLQCETKLYEIMGWESFDVVTFGLGTSFKVKQEQPNLKVLIICLLLVLEVCHVKPPYWKLSAGNLLMSHLTLSSSFKVK